MPMPSPQMVGFHFPSQCLPLAFHLPPLRKPVRGVGCVVCIQCLIHASHTEDSGASMAHVYCFLFSLSYLCFELNFERLHFMAFMAWEWAGQRMLARAVPSCTFLLALSTALHYHDNEEYTFSFLPHHTINSLSFLLVFAGDSCPSPNFLGLPSISLYLIDTSPPPSKDFGLTLPHTHTHSSGSWC